MQTDATQAAIQRRTVIASVVGNAMEWYDFFLYGNAAALIFGQVFFPKTTDPLTATLIAFAGFAIGFLARPIGAVIFGHIGDRAGRRSATLLLGITLGTAVDSAAMLAYGALSDRIGRAPVSQFGAVAMIFLAYPFFWMIASGSTVLILAAFVIVIPICHAAMIGVQPSLLTAMFPADIRYSGLALGHEIGSVIAGGLAPVVATALLAQTREVWPIALDLAAIGVITAVSVMLGARSTRGESRAAPPAVQQA